MPILELATNVEKSKVPPDFKDQLAHLLSKSLGKPLKYIAVHVKAGEDVYFGGSDNVPAAVCTLSSIGALGVEQNKKHSKQIMTLLNAVLGITSDRVYIEFRDLNKANVGFSSTTFHELM